MSVRSARPEQGDKRARVAALGLALVVATATAGFTWWRAAPVSFRLVVLHPVREISYAYRELAPIGHLDRLAVTVPDRPRTVYWAGRDTIALDEWLPDASAAAPAMILLHGASPWGRRNGLIQLLGAELSGKGFVVVAPDSRGFGATPDPVDVTDPEAWRAATDVRRILDYVTGLKAVDGERVFVLGHSMGASQALDGALEDPRVRALILVGPSRGRPPDPRIGIDRWSLTRFSADRRLNAPIPEDVARVVGGYGHLVLFAEGPLARAGHKPVLLVDGAREGAETQRFLADLIERMSPPVTYVTLELSGHYCGVYNLFGSRRVFFRRDAFQEFVDLIIEYVASVEELRLAS